MKANLRPAATLILIGAIFNIGAVRLAEFAYAAPKNSVLEGVYGFPAAILCGAGVASVIVGVVVFLTGTPKILSK